MISSPEEARSYTANISASANATSQILTTKLKELGPLEFLAKIKFDQIGYNPLIGYKTDKVQTTCFSNFKVI